MNANVIVDTCVFIEYLRGNVSDDNVPILVTGNHVLLSPTVRLELLSGLSKTQAKIIEDLFVSLESIKQFPEIKFCEKLIYQIKGFGFTAGIPDMLIIADCLQHKASLFTYDEQMKVIAKRLKVKLLEF